MLDFIRHSRSKDSSHLLSLANANDPPEMSTSRHSSFRSSIDDGPTKASSVGDPGKVASNTPRHTSNPAHTSSLPVSQATLRRWSPKPLSSEHSTPHGSQPSAVPNNMTSAHSYPTSPHFFQASSGILRPSPSIVAAHGEFKARSNTTGSKGDHGCVAQMGIEDGLRDSKNPHGLTLDKSRGYYPRGPDVGQGSRRQSNTTQLGDRPSLEDLLRIIAAERLHHMPQKGSNWDRSTRALESFALRVSSYATRYSSVLGNAELKLTMIYRECYALLRLGRNHAASLVAALGMLAGVTHTLSLFANCPSQPMSSPLQQYLGQVLDRILDLINCLTCYFQDPPAGNITGPSGLRYSLGKPLEAFDLQADQLLNEIWTHHIPSNVQDVLVNFKQVQNLLRPQDEVVRTTQIILHAERGSRHEFTCEWFSKPFLDFVRSSDTALWIDGRIGCGKSVLCGWILESLQSPVDGREYAPIAYSIDPQLPSETSTTSVLKALLRQMVERQYRSSKLYEALAHLMGTVRTGDTPVQIEKALSACLETAISEANQPTMLVIDGLSELNGGEAAAAALFNTLLRFAANNPLVRLMVLSRPFTFTPATSLRRRTTEAKDVHKDIYKVITDLVPTQSSTPAAEVARRIEHEADGNFFWSLLALQEWSAQNFSQQAWRNMPISLEANVVSKLDFLDPMTSIILINSIIATRPLRLVEIEVICRLDVHNRLLKPQSQDIARVIQNACGSVLVVQDGIVLFRHALLKQALLDMLHFENLLLGPEMHADMACRLLLYMKVVLGQRSELTLKIMPSLALRDLLHAHPLLAYALQYWTKHLISSSMFPEPGSFKPNSDCSIIFPDTIQAAIVEASYWKMDPSTESIRVLQTATAVRKEILGDHEATLEMAACLAEALRLRSDFTGAANYFYVASQIAQAALPEFHPFTATCILKFLEVADDIDIPDHASRKANVLRYMISMYDTQTGPSSDQAIEARTSLATHYAATQEHALLIEMYRVMHRLTVDRHGKDSYHAKGAAEKLVTALQYQSEGGDSSYSDSVYDDILQTYDVTDSRRIKALISKAETYRSLEDPFNAELIYVNLWYGLAETCHLQRNIENHEKLLQCGVIYSKFLREYGRMSDSQNVVLGLWSQQQASGYQISTISALLMEVASEMKHVGLQDIALDILHAVRAYQETQNSDAISQAISETTLDMVSDAQSSSNEAALQRILEAKKSQGLTLDDLPLVNALMKTFLDCGGFDDVAAIGAETLHRLWPSVLDKSYGRDPVDTDPFNPELAGIALSLAHAYSKTSHFEGLGLIYWHLFHKARHSETVDDSTAVEYGNLALQAFEQTGQVHRMITLREDLLDVCVARDGERHSKTIEARYALASLYCQEQLLDEARQQYTRIIDNLKQSTFHESAALPALRKLIEIYSREKRWDEAQATYAALWETFLSKGLEFGFNPSNSKALYGDYTALLKKQDPANISRLREITEQYSSVCSALWGDQHSVTMEALLWLADIELSLQPENIKATQLYESIVDGEERIPPDQQDDARATIEAAENRLTDLYRARIEDGRSTTVRTFPLQGKAITRAVRLVGKRYQREKTRWGTSQPATLSTLATWVSLLSQDSRLAAIQELESAIHSLMESDVQPSSLYKAAILLATSYSSNGFIEEGLKTVRGLMERVIFDQYAGRSKLVFLAAFEAHLIGSVVDFAEVHAKILKLSALWECYKQASQGTDLGLAFSSGARLRSFLVEHDLPERGTWIEGELYERFLHNYGAAFAQGIETAQDFFFLLLEELGSNSLHADIANIPSIASAALNNRAGSLLGKGEYMAALNLLIPGFEFLCFVEGFAGSDHSVLTNVLRLGLMLAVPIEDQDVTDRMISLSKIILQETLQQCRSQHLDLFNLVEIEQVSRVASVLGIHKNYEDLEWLLTRLWQSRKNLTFLSQDVVIRIGQRLVEVRFFHGHVDSAIELGEDIFYNVQRVYGTSHTSTVGIASLLSTIYASTGDQSAAKAVIGDVSQLKRPDVKGHTGNEPNREHLLQLYKRSSDTDTIPTALQAPKDWGFIESDDDKGFGDVEYAR